MNYLTIKKIIFIVILSLVGILFMNCEDKIVGTENSVLPPSTEIINIPLPNEEKNPYIPILKVGWKGISENSIIDGYWVSWKSYYLTTQKIEIQEPYFTTEVSQTIAFPSADSINKQVLYVKSQDKLGNIDPIGDSVIFYTKRTLPPITKIEFPINNSSLFIQEESSITWKGAKIICSATTDLGEIKDYSLKIDNGNWSKWQSSFEFYLTKNKFMDLTEGIHTIYVKSRNTAFVEDVTPPQIDINFVNPTHEKEWLLIDGTKDQSGSIERPSDEQMDLFYQQMLSDIQYDSWDIANQGRLTREIIGKYKYVIWQTDDYRSTDLTSYTGLLTDYLNTKGRMLISGWNYYSYFQNNDTWLDSTNIYGNILKDYLHINGARTIEDALLDSILVKEENKSYNINAVDSLKLFSFRKGLFKVIDFNNLGSFTTPLLYYSASDTTESNFNNLTIGFGYHNSEYQIVVAGFPYYYLELDAAKNVFRRSKEFLEKEFPY